MSGPYSLPQSFVVVSWSSCSTFLPEKPCEGACPAQLWKKDDTLCSAGATGSATFGFGFSTWTGPPTSIRGALLSVLSAEARVKAEQAELERRRAQLDAERVRLAEEQSRFEV